MSPSADGRLHREARENEELAKHRAERPKIQQQFADLKRGLSAVTDEEWESIPEVGNLTRKKRKKDERSFVVSDSVIVGDRSRTEYETSLDSRQQAVRPILYAEWLLNGIDWSLQNGGIETPAENGTITNFAEMSQARDKILSLKLDQVSGRRHLVVSRCLHLGSFRSQETSLLLACRQR